ncbi:MAG: PA domain-containing protein [Rhodanobacter sp.]
MIRRNALFSALLAAGLLGLAGTASASQIVIVNKDAANAGLNSTLPVTPVGGNAGTTRGEQARIVFEFAANMWGAVLQGTVPIRIDAKFGPLQCDSTGTVLGSTGVVSYQNWDATQVANMPAGTLSNMWYPAALANQLTGADATSTASHISMSFNGALGTSTCMPDSGWYFGLDGKTPVGQSNLLNVMLHEMGHGLGFSGRTSLTSGAMPSSRDDIYSHFAYSNTYAKAWVDLTNAQRVIAAKDDGKMVLRAPHVVAEAPLFLGPPEVLHISAPAAVAGDYKFGAVSPPANATMSNFGGAIVAAVTSSANPGADGTPTQGCIPFANAADVAGKIALIDRGLCSFDIKVGNARDAGAIGVILANNAPGFVSPAVTVPIPVIVVSDVDGAKLRTGLTGLAGGLAYGSGMSGADATGNVLMYVPTVLAQGSSFSHYDISLSPNALMEPFESSDLIGHINLDLTPALFKDEGWKLNETGQMLLTCNTSVPTWIPGGIVIGANVYANAKMIAGGSATVGGYRAAMHTYVADLASKELVTAGQVTSLDACLSNAETLKQFNAWSPFAPVTLQNGLTVTAQSGKAGTSKLYQIEVPNGALALTLRTLGGTGDVSIYVKVGEAPNPANNTYKSVHAGTNSESVLVARPVAGTYYLAVVGETDYSDVSVLGSFTDTAR